MSACRLATAVPWPCYNNDAKKRHRDIVAAAVGFIPIEARLATYRRLFGGPVVCCLSLSGAGSKPMRQQTDEAWPICGQHVCDSHHRSHGGTASS